LPHDIRLIINDRPDIAALVYRDGCAGGTHVGQGDIAPDDARILCPQPMWVGISTHNLEQVCDADATTADYVAFGPIFPTTTKANPDPVTGVELLREARRLTRKPLVAIGGITAENAAEVFDARADSVAVVRDILTASNPAKRAREFLKTAAMLQRN
jgi:thiamine-phosphate pyrophosphorylase